QPAFGAVKPGSEKAPGLPGDPGKGEEDAGDERELEARHHRFHGRGGDEGDIEILMGDGACDPGPEFFPLPIRDRGSQSHTRGGFQEPVTQFPEMSPERRSVGGHEISAGSGAARQAEGRFSLDSLVSAGLETDFVSPGEASSSFIAPLKSLMPLPRPLAISGIFLAPKSRMTIRRMMMSSVGPRFGMEDLRGLTQK